MRVCRSDLLFHYMLRGEEALPAILEQGLLPLNCFPESEAWRNTEAWIPGFYRSIYEAFAQPVLQRPYTNSGVFLTPIDFRLMPGSLPAGLTRIAIPLETVDPACAALTYMLDGRRTVLPLSVEHLEQTAELWTAGMVEEWFARNQNMLFFYVPQVAAYQPGGIPVRQSWVERAAGTEGR